MAKKKSAKATTTTTNGHAKHARETTVTPSSSGGSTTMLIPILVALVAFGIGILTPPVMKRMKPNTTITSSGAPIRSLTESSNDSPAFACTPESLDEVLHDEYVAGLFVLCFDNKNDDDALHLKVYHGAMRTRWSRIAIAKGLTMEWPTLRQRLADELKLPAPPAGLQPWAIFTPRGERVVDAATAETSGAPLIGHSLVHKLGMGLLFQGGQFIWPGVSIGYERVISLYSIMPQGSPTFDTSRNVTLETLSLVPLVLSVKGFLSETECDHIQEAATPTMEYSGVVLMDHDKEKKASDFRTSQTTFLGPIDDTFVDIDYRTASLVRIPRNHQEHVQVLRYGHTQYYQSHHDFFTPSFYQKDPATLRLIKNGLRNRLATVFWYLSDVAEGGETVFPRFNRGMEKSFDDCETGLLVRPEKGKVIIFYSMTPDGVTDQYSLHGACPVKDGIKWAANKWVWNEKMLYTPA